MEDAGDHAAHAGGDIRAGIDGRDEGDTRNVGVGDAQVDHAADLGAVLPRAIRPDAADGHARCCRLPWAR